MYRSIASLRILLLVLLLFGCNDTSAGSGTAVTPHWLPMVCEEEVDCEETGRNCQHGLCVDGPKDVELRLSASIQPPPDRTDLSPLTYRDVKFSTTNPITMSMPRLVSVHGEVIQERTESTRPLQLYFSRRDDIPGRAFSTSTTTDALGQFSVQLPVGSYTVSMRTESEDVPEHSSKIDIREETEGSMIHLKFPSTSSYIRWSGRLVRLDENRVTVPIEDVSIYATDSISRERSSTATTDKNGNFSFYLSRTASAFEVQIRGTIIEAEGQTFHIPTMSFSPTKVVLDEDAGNTQQLPGFEILLDKLQPDVTIRGTVVDTHGERVAGARVMAQARAKEDNETLLLKSTQSFLSPARATFSERATSDENGEFELHFPPMSEVRLTAVDTTNMLRVSSPDKPFELTKDDREVEIILQDPLSIDFNVTDALGHLVENFDIFVKLQDSTTLSPRDYDTSSSLFDGTYQFQEGRANILQLPSALWQIGIVPRTDLTLPRVWVSYLLTAGEQTVTAHIPQGIAVAFIVEDDKGLPIRDASIELWEENLDTSVNTTQLLGTAQSDTDGRAVIIMPYIPNIQEQ